ncbi:hypothetical protein V5O48_014506, partial [Marasmius crinis-equi]
LVNHLTIIAIQTGTPGSVVAVIGLVVYLVDNESNISVGIAFSLGRIYAITMLHNLNSREKLRETTNIVTGISTLMQQLNLADTLPSEANSPNEILSAYKSRVDVEDGTPQKHTELSGMDMSPSSNHIKDSVK